MENNIPTAKLPTPDIKQKLTQVKKAEGKPGPGGAIRSAFLDTQLDKAFLARYFSRKK